VGATFVIGLRCARARVRRPLSFGPQPGTQRAGRVSLASRFLNHSCVPNAVPRFVLSVGVSWMEVGPSGGRRRTHMVCSLLYTQSH
jgi:hypothetical protein